MNSSEKRTLIKKLKTTFRFENNDPIKKALEILYYSDDTEEKCSSAPTPNKNDIEEFARRISNDDYSDDSDEETNKALENHIINIFDDIANFKGGAAAEEENVVVSPWGFTEDQQDTIIHIIMLGSIGGTMLGGAVGTWIFLPNIEDYLVQRGLMQRICRGNLSRATIWWVKTYLDPTGTLTGASCGERETRALDIMKGVGAKIVAVGGALTLPNWLLIHKHLKTAIFGSVRDQMRAQRQRVRIERVLPPQAVVAAAQAAEDTPARPPTPSTPPSETKSKRGKGIRGKTRGRGTRRGKKGVTMKGRKRGTRRGTRRAKGKGTRRRTRRGINSMRI